MSLRVLYIGPGQSAIVRGRIAPFLTGEERVEACLLTTEPPPGPWLARHPNLRCEVLPRRVLRRLPRWLFLHTADYLLEVQRVVASFRPHLIHVHYVSQLDALALLPVRRIPLVLTVMGADVLEDQIPRPPLMDRAVRALFRRAQAVTAKSEFLAEACRALGVPPERIERVVWGVDTERFRPLARAECRQRLALTLEGRLLASSRALQPLYDHESVLEALLRLRQAGHELPTLVFSRAAQDPGYAARIEGRALELSLPARFLDPLEPEHMPLLFGAVNAVVSVPRSDGLPQTVLEALACRRPVVTRQLEAYRELPFRPPALSRVPLDPGGALPPAALADALSAALETSPEHPTLAEARAWIEAEADFGRSAAQVRALYGSLTGR